MDCVFLWLRWWGGYGVVFRLEFVLVVFVFIFRRELFFFEKGVLMLVGFLVLSKFVFVRYMVILLMCRWVFVGLFIVWDIV